MRARDWQDFDAELRTRLPELVVELLGQPSSKTGQEWRWGHKGSLAVIISGPKAGMWFDHEAGDGSHFSDLVGRELSVPRSDANDWIADRMGMTQGPRPRRQHDRSQRKPANRPAPPPRVASGPAENTPTISPADAAAARAARIWASAPSAPADHPYLITKQVAPLALRIDARGQP
jgi:putative DNA primase/helicase